MTTQSGCSFLGGLRWQDGFSLWPLARLAITAQGIELHPGAGAVRRLVPDRELDCGSLVGAERIARVGLFPAPGVRLLRTEQSAIIFWTLRPRRVLAALERTGIAVTPGGHSAPFWGTERPGRDGQS